MIFTSYCNSPLHGKPVLRIRDILVRIRIRVPAPSDGSLVFSSITFKITTKNYRTFFWVFFAYYFWSYIYIIFQIYKVIEKSQNSRILGFSYYYYFWSVPDPWHFGVDPDPDPAIFVIDLQDANKSLFKKIVLLITFWRYIYIIF